MSVQLINGFDPSKISSMRISAADCKKYGISREEFAKADSNKNSVIEASEFLYGSGMNIVSIFNAFKSMAQEVQGYVDESQKGSRDKKTNNGINPNNQSNLLLAANQMTNQNQKGLGQNIDMMG